MDRDTFTAAYPVSEEHLRWAIDVRCATGQITVEEAEAELRALEARNREASPPRPYDGKDYDALGEEVCHA